MMADDVTCVNYAPIIYEIGLDGAMILKVDRPRFHLAFPVHDLAEARSFYVGVLGCVEGRSSDSWVDFDLAGHQVVAQLAPDDCRPPSTNEVDGNDVPARHFGLLLDPADWNTLIRRLKAVPDIQWVVEPTTRFRGEAGEQRTCFVLDPSGNALEFKSFTDDSQVFAR